MQYKTLTWFLLIAITAGYSCAEEVENLKLTVTESRLPRAIGSHSAVYDGQDSIYVIGGDVHDPPESNAHVFKYTLSSGAVEVVGTFPNITEGAAVMHGEDIIYFGGHLPGHGPTASAHIYRFSTLTGTYALVNNFPTPLEQISVAWDQYGEVAYIFGGIQSGLHMDSIYRYDAADNQFDLVARLPSGRYNTAAVWDAERGAAYVFGGFERHVWLREVLHFDPTTSGSNQATLLPIVNLRSPGAIFAKKHDRAYVLDWNGQAVFDPSTGQSEVVAIEGWRPLSQFAAVYVEKQDRIYILGGRVMFPDEGWAREIDEISYIDLGLGVAPADPVDCGEGATRLISDPFCCESFYFCNAGAPTKYSCPDGQHFNPRNSQCEPKARVGCGIAFVNQYN